MKSTAVPKSLEIYVEHRPRIDEDRNDRSSNGNLAKMYKSSKSGIYYLCKNYGTTGSDRNKGRKRRKSETSAREYSMIARFAQKKKERTLKEIVENLKLNGSSVKVHP
ncbi:hypothetical protein AVEN_20104-1 [Araneus ventricosus]|uniref:Uncharacterized protein n=1 Tax=Araneus ventricosus TaxID=182803 RepID=A0A4Y2M6U1_ARAVE|nr:hypothetical protein AVEN_20104-1 [Araneus ventricosus]